MTATPPPRRGPADGERALEGGLRWLWRRRTGPDDEARTALGGSIRRRFLMHLDLAGQPLRELGRGRVLYGDAVQAERLEAALRPYADQALRSASTPTPSVADYGRTGRYWSPPRGRAPLRRGRDHSHERIGVPVGGL